MKPDIHEEDRHQEGVGNMLDGALDLFPDRFVGLAEAHPGDERAGDGRDAAQIVRRPAEDHGGDQAERRDTASQLALVMQPVEQARQHGPGNRQRAAQVQHHAHENPGQVQCRGVLRAGSQRRNRDRQQQDRQHIVDDRGRQQADALLGAQNTQLQQRLGGNAHRRGRQRHSNKDPGFGGVIEEHHGGDANQQRQHSPDNTTPDRHLAHREQLAQVHFEPHGEHQEQHAQLGQIGDDVFELLGIVEHAPPEHVQQRGAQNDSGEQLAEDARLADGASRRAC